MRSLSLTLVLTAPFLASAPQYRTLNDRFAAPAVTTRDDWSARARYVREHVLASAGLMPMPDRAPLRPVVFDEVTHADYVVAKVYFESLPGFFVTGNLYRPVGAGPFPAILSPHGHWTYGRLENSPSASIPGRAIGLARQGFVVFSHDMIGYDDSRQLPHTFGGRRENLWGLSLGGLQLWNAIRALDFLETLPYVRRGGFGVTGESGGGTQTFLLAAVDDRVAVAAPVNMISLHMQGGCLCENMPGLRLDLNNVEIAGAMAPRPMLMISATGDWTKETLEVEYPAMRRIFDLFGAGDRVHAVRMSAEHNYNKDSREAMYAWMARWLQQAPADVRRQERSFTVDRIEDLLVFYGRPLPAGAVTAAALTDAWIAAARAQLRVADPATLATALRHALNVADAPPPPAGVQPPSKPSFAKATEGRKTVVLASEDASLEPAFRRVGFDVHRVTFTPFDATAAAAVRHFDTYNRTAASQRVADIVAAMRTAPAAVLVADGAAAPAALLAAAVVPISRTIVQTGSFDPSNDEAFLDDRLYIPGLRRAGDFQTAAAMARGEVISRQRLTPAEIVQLARK